MGSNKDPSRNAKCYDVFTEGRGKLLLKGTRNGDTAMEHVTPRNVADGVPLMKEPPARVHETTRQTPIHVRALRYADLRPRDFQKNKQTNKQTNKLR
jgi:hypothetical protein